MPKVSIIMPVYNTGKYLHNAIGSILCQSFKDFELILVDDGSKDNSGDVCDEYAKKDKRVKVIHKKNGGICDARNTALKVVNGKYIAFCDHDDIYLPNLLKDNYALAEKYDADIIKFGAECTQIFSNGKSRKIKNYHSIVKEGFEVIDNTEECFRNFLDSGSVIWNGLYKTSIIKDFNLKFNTSMKFGYEDSCFSLDLFYFTKNIVYNNKIYYSHISRESLSTAFHNNINKLDSQIIIWRKTEEIIPKLQKQNNSYLYEELFGKNISQYMGTLASLDNPINRKEKIYRTLKLYNDHHISWNGIFYMMFKDKKVGFGLLLFKFKMFNIFFILKVLKRNLNKSFAK